MSTCSSIDRLEQVYAWIKYGHLMTLNVISSLYQWEVKAKQTLLIIIKRIRFILSNRLITEKISKT